jgi:hypothetical protein
LYIPVQDNQQMLKDDVSFIILIKLPRHVSAANCHLQGVTHSLQATPVLSEPRVDVDHGLLGVTSSQRLATPGSQRVATPGSQRLATPNKP